MENMIEHKKEKYWSKFAYGYDEGVEYIVGIPIQQAILNILSKERNLGEVIEFGCGTGYFTKAIAKNAKHVIATDLSDEMLEEAKGKLKEYQNVTIEKADCESTSFPSKRFDTVFMVNVIHFIQNPHKCLQESNRILKDGGLLLLADYTGYGMKWFEKMKLGFRFFKICGIPPRHAQTNLSSDEFSSLVEGAGFKVEKNQLIGEKIKALYLRGRKK
jgi:ubiquinone/menaquinone biosynthesis C-methylase UbiE